MAVVLSKKMKREQLWLTMLYYLYVKLSKVLGDNFIKLAAPRNPDVTLHDRNLVVVVRRLSDDVIDAVYDAIDEVEKEFGIENEILPMILEENDAKIEEYEEFFSKSEVPTWQKAMRKLKEKLCAKLANNLVKVISSKNPDVTLHDRNLVVVVRRLSDDVIDAVYDAIDEVEKEFGIENEILPMILEENDAKIEEYERVLGHE